VADSGLAELDAMIARIHKLPELAKNAAPDVARAVELELRRTIGAGTTPDGKPWPAKQSGGKPLLNAAETLAVVAVGSTVVVRLRGPEARHHLGWAKGGIVRQVIPVKDVPPAMAAAIKVVLAKHFNAAVTA
jgi:hypothetical protein